MLLAGGACLLGCGSTTLTRSGPALPSRGPSCEFQLLTLPPREQKFLEIGAIDVQPGSAGFDVYTDIGAFKEKIGPYVCEAGGDAAVAFENGFGWYIKAVILKSVSDASHLDGVSRPAGPPATTTPAIPAAGCHYDTQCKGDRVCVKGECAPP